MGPYRSSPQAPCTVQGRPSITIKVAIDRKNVDSNNKTVILYPGRNDFATYINIIGLYK